MLAAVMLLFTGAAAIRLSPDRWAAFRGLLARSGISAVSFAMLLRIGSWVVSPEGGRAPMTSALSHLAGVKWLVPLAMGMGFLAVGVAVRYAAPRAGFRASKPDPVEVPVEKGSRT